MVGKWIGIMLVAIAFAFAGTAQADTTQDVTLTVTIRSLGISVDPTSYAFGILNTNETKVSETALVVTNTGNDDEDVGVRVKDEDDQDEWTLGTPAENVYALSCRLATTAGTFVAGDALTTTVQWCDGTKFGGGGRNMAKDATVNAWFQLQTPTVVTGDHAADEHAITVEVTCQVAAE